jgi:hypothetical protein
MRHPLGISTSGCGNNTEEALTLETVAAFLSFDPPNARVAFNEVDTPANRANGRDITEILDRVRCSGDLRSNSGNVNFTGDCTGGGEAEL